MTEHLIERCLDAYWRPEMDGCFLRSQERMQAVLELLSAEISSWAPDRSQAKICYLAINEVAERLLSESNASNSKPIA